jgi:hypothetical protein
MSGGATLPATLLPLAATEATEATTATAAATPAAATCPVAGCREKRPNRPDKNANWQLVTPASNLRGWDGAQLPCTAWVCCRHGQHTVMRDECCNRKCTHGKRGGKKIVPSWISSQSKKQSWMRKNFRSTDIDIAGGQQELGSKWDIGTGARHQDREGGGRLRRHSWHYDEGDDIGKGTLV